MRSFISANLIYPTYLSLGLLGFLFSSVGVALPVLRNLYGLSMDEAGLVSALVQMNFAAFCFIGGILSDTFGKKIVLIFGCLLYGFSGLLMGIPTDFSYFLFLFAVLGVASGLIFTSSNSLVVALYPEQRARYLNIHHLVFAIASFLSPLVCSRLLAAGAPWYLVYILLGVPAIVIAVPFVIAQCSPQRRKPTPGGDSLRRAVVKYCSILKNREFLLLVASGWLGIGSQFGVIYLLVIFLTQARAETLPVASGILAAFFVLMSVGRYLCAYLVRKISIDRIILILLSTLLVFLLAGWFSQGWPALVFLAFTGLSCSGLIPNMIAIATRILPENVRGSSLGVLSMFGGLGGMTVTYITTLVAVGTGLNTAFLVVPAAVVVSLVFFVVFLRATAGKHLFS